MVVHSHVYPYKLIAYTGASQPRDKTNFLFEILAVKFNCHLNRWLRNASSTSLHLTATLIFLFLAAMENTKFPNEIVRFNEKLGKTVV